MSTGAGRRSVLIRVLFSPSPLNAASADYADTLSGSVAAGFTVFSTQRRSLISRVKLIYAKKQTKSKKRSYGV